MWAVLDYDNKTVVGVLPPDMPESNRLQEANGRMLIPMTIENSPAYAGGVYINGKFYRTESEANNNG
jgi:hypothetical protein